jgi:methionine-gamma-lyase
MLSNFFALQVLYTEVLSNPTLVVSDLPALASIAHTRGSQLVVDNTFTPLAVTPARWGADVVVHSMTKFISGASDIIAGAVCGSNQFLQQCMDLHTGACGFHCT